METIQRIPKPVPDVDDYSRPFFEQAARGTLMLRQCDACSTYLSYVATGCPECLGDSLSWAPAAGTATLFSFGIVHQKYHPAFEADLPYNIAIVELPEGPRLNTSIVGVPNDALEVGMALKVTFDEMAPGVHIPRFQPQGSAE